MDYDNKNKFAVIVGVFPSRIVLCMKAVKLILLFIKIGYVGPAEI